MRGMPYEKSVQIDPAKTLVVEQDYAENLAGFYSAKGLPLRLFTKLLFLLITFLTHIMLLPERNSWLCFQKFIITVERAGMLM